MRAVERRVKRGDDGRRLPVLYVEAEMDGVVDERKAEELSLTHCRFSRKMLLFRAAPQFSKYMNWGLYNACCEFILLSCAHMRQSMTQIVCNFILSWGLCV